MFVIAYGALRSGTTMLRLMLDMHPNLSCPNETDFLFDYLTPTADGDVTIDAEALDRDWIYAKNPAVLNPDLSGKAAILDMIEQMRNDDSQVVVLMLHRGLEAALRLFPEVPVLHMLRDPRDVARSSIGMGWAGTVYHGVRHWIRTEREWGQAAAANPHMITQELKYETLIAEPEAELRSIAEFFGVEFLPEMLQYHTGSTYTPPDLSLVEQWKRKQSPQEIGLVEGALGPLLTARGYAPSGHDPITPNALQRLRLWMTHKSATIRVRVERYGFRDPAIVRLARAVRLPQLGYAAQRRIDLKRAAYLK